ncbi:hypothetical protein EB796_000537 [Bugula neritina]|uniref:Uncharacterized protein n=1 Tax=Bugula neritina TaxID=10212 RepID=A0A7J7KST9_BUGNE|nr:hypothetical protein EB796_000537 [Bugula neritina]
MPIVSLTEPITESETSIEKLVSKAHKLDSKAIRDIYLRVLAQVTAEKRVKDTSTSFVCSSTQTDITATNTGFSTSLAGNDCGVKTNDNDVFWNSIELLFLRDHYKREHDDYLTLKAELKAANEETRVYQEKYMHTNSEILKTKDKFHKREAYINRLEKLHQSLKEEIVRITNQVVVTENELKELQQSYQLKCSSEQQLSSKLSDSQIKCKLLQTKLDKANLKCELDTDRQLQKLKLEHETEVSNLTDRLNNLEERLETERELHERCKKGLGQLMLHYSQSTQVQGIIDAGGNDKNCAKI